MKLLIVLLALCHFAYSAKLSFEVNWDSSKNLEITGEINEIFGKKLIANFSPNFKFKICQKFKISHAKITK
jgi:hypothetical protein